MSFTLCSIDASTKSTGLSLFNDGVYSSSTLIQFGDKEMDKRFKKMSDAILLFLEDNRPDIIYMEEAVVLRNAQTQRFLVRLQGVVYAWSILNNADCEFIRPTEWRSLVGIKSGKKKREELKKEAINLAKEKLNIEVNDDVAESILIGMAAINKYN